MKRKLEFVLFVLLSFNSLVFADNLQKIYTTRDNEYKRVQMLCYQAGVIGPSSFSPMPARALIIALDRIDPSVLSQEQLAEYNELYAILTHDDALYQEEYFTFDIDAAVNLGINIADYSNFNYGNVGSEELLTLRTEETLVPYRYEKPFLSLGLNMTFGDIIYLEGRIDLKNNNRMLYESSLGWAFSPIASANELYTGMAIEWPYRAGLSIGNNYVNVILGRFPHSAGNGVTGNLIIGDNFNYQEVLNVSFMSNHFTYNISITRFDQQLDNGDGTTTLSRSDFSGMQQFRVMHRFDVSFLNRVRIALNLATIFNSNYGLDFRFFAPFIINHNYYNYSNDLTKHYYDEANNLMGIELEYVITKGLTASAQIALDQIQAPWENYTELPIAYGALGNIKYTFPVKKGNINTWFEVVYTNPYLYLNGKTYTDNDGETYIDYNLDYIVGYRTYYMDDIGYSGYVYGPDTIVLSLGGSYTDRNNLFEVGGNIIYKIHGEKGLRINANDAGSTKTDMSDSVIEDDSDIFMDNTSTPSGGLKTAEHLIKLAAYGEYNFNDLKIWGKLSVYAAVGFNLYFNYDHLLGVVKFKPQMMVGVEWTY